MSRGVWTAEGVSIPRVATCLRLIGCADQQNAGVGGERVRIRGSGEFHSLIKSAGRLGR